MGAVRSASDVSRRCVEQLKEIIEQENSAQAILDNRRFQTAIRLLTENVDIVVEGSDRISTIIRSLKTFARLDEAELDKADIHEGLDSTLTLLQHELKNKAEVKRNYGDIPPIYCYPQELNQVFMNLLSNAVQAIEKKGTIRIKTSTDAANVYVKITDTGRGIPPEKLNKIFDPGFTTKGVGIGTGLGLSISHNWGYPFNRTDGRLSRWITLVLARTIRGPWASSRPGFAPMRTAWTTWSGYDGPLASPARGATTMGAGGWVMGASSALGAAAVRR